jgi:hypothetical protein
MGAGEISIRRQQDIVNFFPFFFRFLFILFLLFFAQFVFKKNEESMHSIIEWRSEEGCTKNGSPDSWIKERERLTKNV